MLVHNQGETCRGLTIAGSRADLDVPEASYFDILEESGLTIVGTGDPAVRVSLGIPDGPAPDFLSYNVDSDRFTISEVKASFSGEAEIGTAVRQLTAAAEALQSMVQGARIARLEVVIPEGGLLESPFAVSGNQLVEITAEGTSVVRIAGNVVTVVEAPLQRG